MTSTRDLIRLAKAANAATDTLERVRLLRDLEDTVTPVRRDALLAALKVHDQATVARALGVSKQAVHYQAQHARNRTEQK